MEELMKGMMMRLSAMSVLLILSAMFVMLLTANPASAQYQFPCNGPGPGRVMVGTAPPPPGSPPNTPPTPVCVADNGQGASTAALVDYASIAWHPDYDEVWFAGGYSQKGRSEGEILKVCNRDTGGGCTPISDFSNSYIAIVKAADGFLQQGWGNSAGEAKRAAQAKCRQGPLQRLPCLEVKTFSALSRKFITPKDLRAARKLYGAGAWVSGESYDSRAWFATGQQSWQGAIDSAIGSCVRANPGQKCEAFVVTGNGFIQTYRRLDAQGKSVDEGGMSEVSAKRAAQAVQTSCQADGLKCALQIAYDTRRPAMFVHNFKKGTSE
jgi:Domain of unknown function (DUF4189)